MFNEIMHVHHHHNKKEVVCQAFFPAEKQQILGIVFVIKVRKQEKVFHNGLVTAGLILCICGFVLSLLFLAYWIWYLFVFLCTVETQPHHEAPPPMPKYHGHPAKFLLSFYFQR